MNLVPSWGSDGSWLAGLGWLVGWVRDFVVLRTQFNDDIKFGRNGDQIIFILSPSNGCCFEMT